MKPRHLFLAVIAVCMLLFSSCHTSQKIVYFQDVPIGQAEDIYGGKDIRVQPKDQVSIIVSSKDPQLASLFNLMRAQNRAGVTSGNSYSSGNGETSGYTIDDEGNIDFPILGYIHVAGMTKSEIAKHIKERLINEDLIKDPVVTVEFMNLYFSVLGEVSGPGQYSITKDQITLLEALSKAGDLTIFGKRNDIEVIREENGKRTTYCVDIRSKSLFYSPVYYLKQNDVIYVKPNKVRAGQSTVNENNLKSVSMWMSICSFLMSIGIILTR